MEIRIKLIPNNEYCFDIYCIVCIVSLYNEIVQVRLVKLNYVIERFYGPVRFEVRQLQSCASGYPTWRTWPNIEVRDLQQCTAPLPPTWQIVKFEQVFHVGRLLCRSSCVESDSTRTELNCGGELRKPLFPKFNSTVQLDGHNKPQKDMWHLNFERT